MKKSSFLQQAYHEGSRGKGHDAGDDDDVGKIKRRLIIYERETDTCNGGVRMTEMRLGEGGDRLHIYTV